MHSSPAERVLDGKYRLIRKLDEGGMGAVWLAEHLSLRSPVAVKLIAEEVAATQLGVQRFMREARTSASLRSPHVVQILDHGVDDGTPYIVMELLHGESLAERLKRVGRLSAAETELVLRQVSRAVGLAHDAGVVHRDLKPANIFIIANDDEELVKLLDFGIAKATLGGSVGGSTRTGAFLGTPHYVSPEQAEGVRDLDHRTDVWAMGVIAFECLLGRLPFSGDTFGSVVLSICSRPMPVPSQHGLVPAGFDHWFARACARDPEQRFQSAREAARELRAVLGRVAADHAPPKLEPQAAPIVLDAAPQAYLADTTAAASSSAVRERSGFELSRRMLALGGFAAVSMIVAAFVLFGGGASKKVDLQTTHAAALPVPKASPSSAPSGEQITIRPIQAPVQEPAEVAHEAANPEESEPSRAKVTSVAPSEPAPRKRTTRKAPAPQRKQKKAAPPAPAAAVQAESPKQGVDLGL